MQFVLHIAHNELLRYSHDGSGFLLQSAKMEVQADSAAATLASVKTKTAPKAKPSKPAAKPTKEPADSTAAEDTRADTEMGVVAEEAEAIDDSMAELPEAAKAEDTSGKHMLLKPLQVHHQMFDGI